MEISKGSVQRLDGVTIVKPGIDEVDADQPTKPNRTPREIMEDAFGEGQLRAQMARKRYAGIYTPMAMQHVCHFWKLRLERRPNKRVMFSRGCISYTRGKVEFEGCGKYQSFSLLPEKEARELYRKIKDIQL